MHQTLERELPWRPDQLFDLVGDVESYPKFIPWISALSITDRSSDAQGRPVVEAQASVGYSFVRERFSSRVTLDKPALEIRVDLLSGPLKRLENLWRFAPSGQGCHLAFAIDFEFKSRLLTAMLAANMALAVRRLVACFEARARALYG